MNVRATTDEPVSPAPPPRSGEAAGAKPTGGVWRKRLNLFRRLLSALTAIALMYYCLRWDVTHSSGWAWAALMACGCAIGLREFYRLAVACGTFPFSLFGRLVGPAWILALEWDLSGGSRAFGMPAPLSDCLALFMILGSMLLQLTRKSNRAALSSVAVTVFGFVYCCWLPGYFSHMRHMALAPTGWPMHGIEFVITCIFVSKVSDVGALMTGSRWGRRKLIPRLSPGKTWEGALGGLLFSVLLLHFMVWTSPGMAIAGLGTGWLLLLSVLMAAGGLAGDLVESCFKRNSRMKDAGGGIPGFGGMLDLTDSLMVAAPLMYAFLLLHGARYVQ